MKPVVFLADTLRQVRRFPEDVRRTIGHELRDVQFGEEPSDWKPMPSVGSCVREIRVRDPSGAFRVIYVANLEAAIYVLHAFQKKTQQTPQRDIDLARSRLKAVAEER
ncbi:MAG TPA: type II toxin-antitoxin system RelE/ParE family toxin [Caulobacteraceae bacterium]|jgi:phage-related protein